MKNLNDENIQRLLEQEFSGSNAAMPSSSNDKDFKLYQILFKKLGKESELRLPHNFSAKIAVRLHRQKERASERRFFILLAAISLTDFSR